MILRGILERSLGGFICLRGFAPLNELAKISKPEISYQRELVEEHRKDIEDFLDSREYVYFPEITLSYSINAVLDNINLSTSSDLLDLGSVKDKIVKASQFNKPYVSKSDQRDKDLVRIVTIEIDDDKGLGLLNRIDGNHRLSASENIGAVQADILTPFCLILLAGEEDTNAKQQSVIFHNINSKGLALTPEENLKGIIDGNRFSDAELKETFGWEFLKVRKILPEVDTDYLCSLKHVFGDKPRNAILSALSLLSARDLVNEKSSIKNIKQKLADVNAIYKNEPRLKICNEIGIFTAFLNYAFKSTDDINLLHPFANWLIFNYIYEVKSPDAASVIDVFDKVHSSQLSVFMAMPYFNDVEVDFANKSLSGAVASIKNNNPHVNLLGYPIMRTCSPTHDLIEDIFNKIKVCDIFIADITDNNPNVLYEYGFARGQNKNCILMRKQNSAQPVKSDYANDLRFEYGQFDLGEKLKVQIEYVLEASGIVINR